VAEPLAFPLLIKPTSDRCNLRCSYCFYLGTQPKREPMRRSLLAALIGAYREVSSGESYVWQGGEPTLMGAGFFEYAVSLQGEGAANSIQTNGLALVQGRWQEWAGVLKGPGNWAVGLSHDGPTNRSRGVKTSALDFAARMLGTWGVPFTLLCVVSEENAGKADAVMRHFERDELVDAPIQFIHAKGSAVTGEQFAQFLLSACQSSSDHGARIANYVSVDAAWNKRPAMTCEVLEECGNYLAVESDGTLFPCDFFMREEWRLGQVHADFSLEENGSTLRHAFTGRAMQEFRKLKTTPYQKCEGCDIRQVCHRGCPADRSEVDGSLGLSVLCPAHTLTGHETHPQVAGRGQDQQADPINAGMP